MEFVVVCAVAFIASALTFFSGFGLGTLLLPVFALFFPPGIAVAMTAVVHLFNNIGKFALIGRHADRGVALRFGLPAVIFAFLGARVLVWMSGLSPWVVYELAGKECQITPVKAVIAALMIIFAIVEIVPAGAGRSFDRRMLPVGGGLSGFFGGVSGHQGALRSAFLIKCGLSKEAFIATGVVIAVVVDVVRVSVYGSRFLGDLEDGNSALLIAAIVFAFLGAAAGKRMLTKVTLRAVQVLVATMLFLVALGLGSGLI